MRIRVLLAACIVMALALSRGALPAYAGNPSCGELTYRNPQGGAPVYKVLFAKNGAVQSFRLVESSNNPELDHDTQRQLVREYGPEGTNAPPLTIVSYKPGSGGGMMVPDKAVDSCGRVSHFQ